MEMIVENTSLHNNNTKQFVTRPRCTIFKNTKYFSKKKNNYNKMVPTHQISYLKVIPLRKSPIFDPFVVRKTVKGS